MVQLKYVKENRGYQRLLDKHYHGKIVPIGRYVNGKAVIKHYCLKCNKEFWAKPGFFINLKSNRHYCIEVQPVAIKDSQLDTKEGKFTEELKGKMLTLYDQGIGVTEISRRLEVSRDTIRYHLKKVNQG